MIDVFLLERTPHALSNLNLFNSNRKYESTNWLGMKAVFTLSNKYPLMLICDVCYDERWQNYFPEIIKLGFPLIS